MSTSKAVTKKDLSADKKAKWKQYKNKARELTQSEKDRATPVQRTP